MYGVGCCAAGTGFDLATGLGTPTVDGLARAISAPEVDLQVDGDAVATAPVTLSAAGSTASGGTITAYAWDLDGDGAIDTTTTEPAATRADAAGTHQPAVTESTSLGRSATATASVTIGTGQPAPLELPATG